jgi:hypothetical protein
MWIAIALIFLTPFGWVGLICFGVALAFIIESIASVIQAIKK